MPDVIIIGGGVAGATAALGLQRQGVQATLVEAQPAPAWRIGETLAAESRPLLQSLDLWEEHLLAGHLPSYGTVSCWGWEAAIDQDFTANPYGNSWQLDRRAFEEMLTRAAAKSGAQVLKNTHVTGFERQHNLWHVQAGNEKLSAPWIIDASGRRSFFARQLGIRRYTQDKLVAIYTTATSTNGTDKDSRTHIEALPDGWLYTALTPGGRRTVCFQSDADLLQPTEQCSSFNWFVEKLKTSRHLSALLKRHNYHLENEPALTSAHSGRLQQFSGAGWVAIGDAAMSFDPVTGNGMYKGMLSAIKSVEAITSTTPKALAGYEAWSEELWRQFTHAHQACYSQESRWPDAPFWRRRGGRQIGES